MSLDQEFKTLIRKLDRQMDQIDPNDEYIAAIDILHEKAEMAAKLVNQQPHHARDVYQYVTRRFEEIQKVRQLETT